MGYLVSFPFSYVSAKPISHFTLLLVTNACVDLYYSAFPNDPKKFKFLVYFVYLLETAQTIIFTHDAFERFVYGFANPDGISKINLIWFSSPFVDGLGEFIPPTTECSTHFDYNVVALLVQLQFAYRIRLLSPKSRFVLVLILTVSLRCFCPTHSNAGCPGVPHPIWWRTWLCCPC